MHSSFEFFRRRRSYFFIVPPPSNRALPSSPPFNACYSGYIRPATKALHKLCLRQLYTCRNGSSRAGRALAVFELKLTRHYKLMQPVNNLRKYSEIVVIYRYSLRADVSYFLCFTRKRKQRK